MKLRPHLTGTAKTSFSQTLRELRIAHQVSQQDLANAIGSTQPGVLKAEGATDPQISTIRRYIEGLGAATGTAATLEVIAVIDGQRYEIKTPKGTLQMIDQHTPSKATPTVWRLRAWDEPSLEERFLKENVIAMSADEIGDMSVWPDEDDLRRRLRAGTTNRGEQAIGTFVRYWHDFRNEMRRGDLVVVPLLGRRAAIGIIEGDYIYRPNEVPKMRHARTVRWLRTTDRAALDDGIRKVVNAPGTICRIKAPGAATALIG